MPAHRLVADTGNPQHPGGWPWKDTATGFWKALFSLDFNVVVWTAEVEKWKCNCQQRATLIALPPDAPKGGVITLLHNYTARSSAVLDEYPTLNGGAHDIECRCPCFSRWSCHLSSVD
jgi:hypothetical protein